MQLKAVIRTQIIQVLTDMDPIVKQRQSEQLISALVGTSMWQKAHSIGLTMSTGIELDTRPLIAQALAAGKQVSVPRTLPHHQMAFVTLGAGVSFETSSFGIKEPVGGQVISVNDMDLMVIPGVAFSDNGQRIGFGAGYYDRYLADYQGTTVSLVLTTQRFKKSEWQNEPFDIKIDHIISL